MKANPIFRAILMSVCVLVFGTASWAQETKPYNGQAADVPRPETKPPGDGRADMFRQLGLTGDQIQQIRHLNQQRKPLMEEAQKQLRQAMHTLDTAIYADQVNEADVQARLEDVHRAQAEVARIRFTNELSVRKILTQEQLLRFRELRQQFEQARKNSEVRGRERPLKRQIPGAGGKPQGAPPAVQCIGRPIIQRPTI